ncbi:MAG: hypothetical protein ABIQ59_16455 [Nocardioidaceae bacterium]
MDLVLRPLTHDDIPAWVALLAAVEAVEHTGEHYGAADLVEEMANPEVEVGRDFMGAFDGDDLVGIWTVLPRAPGRAPSRCTSTARCGPPPGSPRTPSRRPCSASTGSAATAGTS